MIAVATALFQRALAVGVLPTTKTGWVAFGIGFTAGLVTDFVAWWTFSPVTFNRYVVRPVRALISDHGRDDDNGGTDRGEFAMWAWCPGCGTYVLDEDSPCPTCLREMA